MENVVKGDSHAFELMKAHIQQLFPGVEFWMSRHYPGVDGKDLDSLDYYQCSARTFSGVYLGTFRIEEATGKISKVG